MASPVAGAVLAGVVVALLAGCDAEASAPRSAPPAATAPTDWIVVATQAGDLQLTLPPWLITFDRSAGIWANEAPPAPGAEIPVQLYALGPDRAAATEFGADLRRWIELHVTGQGQGAPNPGEGVPALRQLQLPAGQALRYARIDRPGTALEWRFLVFAIRTPTGLAYLQLDGTAAGFTARAPDLDLIALLLRTR